MSRRDIRKATENGARVPGIEIGVSAGHPCFVPILTSVSCRKRVWISKATTSFGKKQFCQSKGFLKILAVTLLAEVVTVCGQFITEETLHCSKAVPAITKVGSHSCACDNKIHVGALKFEKGKRNVWGKNGYP